MVQWTVRQLIQFDSFIIQGQKGEPGDIADVSMDAHEYKTAK